MDAAPSYETAEQPHAAIYPWISDCWPTPRGSISETEIVFHKVRKRLVNQSAANKPFLEVLSGRSQRTPPLWMMRQAGRYLPEYREVRAKAGGFLDLCFNPDFAVEVTLQPIRQFNFDAAIIFSDILVIPYALGRSVRFEVGEGPRLDPLDTPDKVANAGARCRHGQALTDF